ncbi:hypothetical protein Hanom_Chr04g00291421 [Helianthus anomalus]
MYVLNNQVSLIRRHAGSLTQYLNGLWVVFEDIDKAPSDQPWKKSLRTTNLLFMDPTNPQWGWSWLERYMAGQPWETEKNQSSVKNGINIIGPEIAKSYARRQLNSTPSTPKSAAVTSQKVKCRSNSRTTFGFTEVEPWQSRLQ